MNWVYCTGYHRQLTPRGISRYELRTRISALESSISVFIKGVTTSCSIPDFPYLSILEIENTLRIDRTKSPPFAVGTSRSHTIGIVSRQICHVLTPRKKPISQNPRHYYSNTMKTIISTDFVVTDRNGVVENRHAVHAAIVDSTGRLLYSVGDPSRMTLARSAAKPAQALAIAETGAFERFNFTDEEIALTCASHSSEERHIKLARNMLTKIQAHESDLQCGGHTPLSQVVHHTWIQAGLTPTAICSNCSGKHAGMIAGTKALGADVRSYHLPDHPMQVHVKKVVDEVCGLEEGESIWGLDGCNLPAPAFPLHCLGRMYAAFASAASEKAVLDFTPVDPRTERIRRIRRVFHAMARCPEFVAGDGRFCTALMKACEGSLIGKLGADGCYGIAVRESETTKKLGAEAGIGIAVKIEDGNVDMLYSAVAEILEQLQIGNPEMRRELARFHRPQIKNTVGVVTGRVLPAFTVRPV